MLRIRYTDDRIEEVDAESYMCLEGGTLLRKRTTAEDLDEKDNPTTHPFKVIGSRDTRTIRDIIDPSYRPKEKTSPVTSK